MGDCLGNLYVCSSYVVARVLTAVLFQFTDDLGDHSTADCSDRESRMHDALLLEHVSVPMRASCVDLKSVSSLLTILGFLPGCIHALWLIWGNRAA